MNDVPLQDANILWTGADANGPHAGTVTVEDRHLPRDETLYFKHQRSSGACVAWHGKVGDDRFAELLKLVQCMTVREGISPQAVHEALSVIPEYRQLLASNFAEFEAERCL